MCLSTDFYLLFSMLFFELFKLYSYFRALSRAYTTLRNLSHNGRYNLPREKLEELQFSYWLVFGIIQVTLLHADSEV